MATETPSIFTLDTGIELRSPHILAIEEHNIYWRRERRVGYLFSELACHLEQHPHPAGTIVGTGNIEKTVFVLLFLITPGASVVVRTKEDSRAVPCIISIEMSDDIEYRLRTSAIIKHRTFLQLNLRTIRTQLLHKEYGTIGVRFAIRDTRTETELAGDKLIGCICRKSRTLRYGGFLVATRRKCQEQQQ